MNATTGFAALCFAAGALSFFGCADRELEPETAPEGLIEGGVPSGPDFTDPALDEVGKALYVPAPTLEVVPELAGIDVAPRVSTDTAARFEVPEGFSTEAPVLIVDRPELTEGAHIIGGPDWWTVGMPHEDGSFRVHIEANLLEREYPDLRAELEEAGYDPAGPNLSASHNVWTVHFQRFGVSYSMDVECSRPVVDERCNDETFLMELYEDLAVLEVSQ